LRSSFFFVPVLCVYHTMRFPIDVVTIGGEVIRITARDDWSVCELEREVEKSMDVRPNLYKLVTSDGDELQSGPLYDFCPAEKAIIFLVKLPKSQQEVEWFEKWSNEAPAWLKKMGDGPINAKDTFTRNTEGCTTGETAHGWVRHSSAFHDAKYAPTPHQLPHPTNMLRDPSCPCQPRPKPLLKTSGEVLDLVRKTKSVLRGVSAFGSNVTLQWSTFEREATQAAVTTAIGEEPHIMLEPFQCNEDISDLLDLVVASVAKHPKIYERLPDYLMEEQEVLYTAMEADPELREEFLRMAGRCEIRAWKEWQFPKASRHSSCRWSKRCKEE